MVRAAAEQVVMSRAMFAQQAGLTFGGKRDMNKALGYAPKITPLMMRQRYDRGGVAQALVNAFPKATWGEGASVYDDEDPKNQTKFEKDVVAFCKRLKVWQVLTRLDILTGLGRYGVLLIGRGQDLAQPAKKGRIQHLQPLGEQQALVTKVDNELSSERFGLVERYGIKFNEQGSRIIATAADVHYSHCIHFVENPLVNEIYGEPLLQVVWNLLDDLDKLVGGGAEAAWHRAHMGMHANVQPDAAAGLTQDELQAQMEKISEQLDEYDNNMRRFIKTVGMDLSEIGGAPFTFDSNGKFIIALIAATTMIPQRRLLGSGIGEMTGKMEDDTFNDVVSQRRTTTAEPLLRQLIDAAIESGDISAPAGGKYEIEWPEEEELDEAAKATLTGALATANASQKTAGGDPIFLAEEIRDKVWGLDPIDEKKLQKLREQNAPPAPPPGAPGADPNAPDVKNGKPPVDGVPPPAADKSTAPPPPAAAKTLPPPRVNARGGGGAALQKHVQRAADEAQPKFEAAAKAALMKMRTLVDVAALRDAIARQDAPACEAILARAAAQFGGILDLQLVQALTEQS